VASLHHSSELLGRTQSGFEMPPCHSKRVQILLEVICGKVAGELGMGISGLGTITGVRRRKQRSQVVRWTNHGFHRVAISTSAGRTQRRLSPLERTQRCEFFEKTIHSHWLGGQISWSKGRVRALDSDLGERRPGDRMIRTTETPPRTDRVPCFLWGTDGQGCRLW